jgi:apolipoprotein N-acyltransferase
VLRPSLRHPIRAALLAGLVLPLAYPPFYVLPIFYLSTGLAFYLALGPRAGFDRARIIAIGAPQGFGAGGAFGLGFRLWTICQRHGVDWRSVFGRGRYVFMGFAFRAHRPACRFGAVSRRRPLRVLARWWRGFAYQGGRRFAFWPCWSRWGNMRAAMC